MRYNATMRLWHYKLIPFLPDKQLVSQWRELNLIFKKQSKFILIDYVYEYDKDDLWVYTYLVINELQERGFNIRSLENFYNYFGDKTYEIKPPFKNHHNDRYLKQCFYNLQEKYDRDQKDFSREIYERLERFVNYEIH